jgi:hypothetical protein
MRLLCALLTLYLLLTLWQTAFAQSEAQIKPFDLPSDSTYEFAIMGTDGQRFATAYYRILKEDSQGREMYRLKYMARNEVMSESTECWFDPATMLPVRSVRKLVESEHTTYQDIAYTDGVIVIRRKIDNGAVQQRDVPAPPAACYDYETLFWLIPQVVISNETQAMLGMFSMVNEQVAHCFISDLGSRQLVVGTQTYEAHAYSVRYGLAPYTIFTVMQNGYPTPARVEMGNSVFVNIKLDPAKAKTTKPKTKQK